VSDALADNEGMGAYASSVQDAFSGPQFPAPGEEIEAEPAPVPEPREAAAPRAPDYDDATGTPASPVEQEGVYDSEGGYWSPEELAAYRAQQDEAYTTQVAEYIEDLAEEDPVAAAQLLGQALAEQQAAQLRAENDQRLAPIIERHNHDEAASTIGHLQAELGDLVAIHREGLAAVVAADPERFMDPATRDERLMQTIKALEYDRLQGIDHGQMIRDEIDYARMSRYDNAGPDRRISTEIPGLTNAQVAALRRGERPAGVKVKRTVHVEGGSTPAPRPSLEYVDPEVAAIAAAGAPRARDAFGALY
jgi:hypothetical protein